jgi:hypothetical protein
MIWRNWRLAAATVGLMVAGTSPGRAGDTLQLGTSTDAAITTLESKGDADTVPVWWRGRPYYRGAWWGGRPYYRGWYGYYRPWGWGYRPRAWGYYYPGYYFAPPYAYSYAAPVYYSPVTYDVYPTGSDRAVMPGATTTPNTRPEIVYPKGWVLPPPKPVPNDGTFQYDGGPQQPVPMPQAEPAPTKIKPAPVPGGRVVSFTAPAAKYTYRAYGEKLPAASPDNTSPSNTYRVQLRGQN